MLQKFPFDNNKSRNFNIDNYNFTPKKNDKIIKINKEKVGLEYDSMYFALISNKGITNSEVIEVESNHGLTASQNFFSYNDIAFDMGNDQSMYMQIVYSVINPWYTYNVGISGDEYDSQVTYIKGNRIYNWRNN